MSEEKTNKESKPQVCEIFEPQTWRKTVCKNCFQPPEKHAVIGGIQSSGPDMRQEEIRSSISPEKRASTGTDAASIKNKYEQLEKDKFKGKQPPPKVMPKPATAQDGKHIPTSPVEDKTNSLMKSKFGSVENISTISSKTSVNLSPKQKFGSVENLSAQTRPESVTIPIQRSKFGGSMESIASHQEEKSIQSKRNSLLTKLDAFSSEFKVAATSKSTTSTVIHTKADGITEITSPSKAIRSPFLASKIDTNKYSEPTKDQEIKVLHMKTNESKEEIKTLPPVKDIRVSPQKQFSAKTQIKEETETKFHKPELTKPIPDDNKKHDKKDTPSEKESTTDLRNVDLRSVLKKAHETTDRKDSFKTEPGKSFELPSLKLKQTQEQKPEIKSVKQEPKDNSKAKTSAGNDKPLSTLGNRFAKPELKSSSDPTTNKLETSSTKTTGSTKVDKPGDKSGEVKNKLISKSAQEKDTGMETDTKGVALWKNIRTNALGNKLKKEPTDTSSKETISNKSDGKIPPGRINQNILKKDDTKSKVEQSKLKSDKDEVKKMETKKEEAPRGTAGLPFKLKKADINKSVSKQDDQKQDLKTKVNKQDSKSPINETITSRKFGIGSFNTESRKDQKESSLKSPIVEEPKNRFERPALKSTRTETKTDTEQKIQPEDIQKNKFAKPMLNLSKNETTETPDILKKLGIKDSQSKNFSKTDLSKDKISLKHVDANQEKVSKTLTPSNEKKTVINTTNESEEDSIIKSINSKTPGKEENVKTVTNKTKKPDANDKKITDNNKNTDEANKALQNVNKTAKPEEEQNNIKNLLAGLKSTKSDEKSKRLSPADLKSPDADTDKLVESEIEVSKNKFTLPALKSSKREESSMDKKKESEDIGDTGERLKEASETKISVKTISDIDPSVGKEKENKNDVNGSNSSNSETKPNHAKAFSDPVKGNANDNEIKKDINTSPTKMQDKETNSTISSGPLTDGHSIKASQNDNSQNGSVLVNEVNEVTIDEPARSASGISNDNFDGVSVKVEAGADDIDSACTKGSTHVHVDTQVFTSSRGKAAGAVGSLDTDQNTASPKLDISVFAITEDKPKQDSWKSEKDLQNGGVSQSRNLDETRINGLDNVCSLHEAELEKLRSEMVFMNERCVNLEKENENLRHGLNKKESDALELRKLKNEVELTVNGLRGQVKKMEERCSNLESDNSMLSGDLKMQKELNQSSDSDDKTSTKDKMMEDLLEENETLRQEINDLKAEMEEMYDSFRDQEAEEFRELQKELEITAKNCRILQFKLRKMERRNDQIEHDRNLYEDKLRTLQSQFQDRDAVAHIRSLEDELRMAKEVSVRLHDELDLMEDKRSKLDDENRHLTDLLEQADRKQFRLEMEVDKLRDKVVQLKEDVRMASGEAPRKLNCAEFLAMHREVV